MAGSCIGPAFFFDGTWQGGRALVRVEADSPTAQLLAAQSTKMIIDLLEQTTAPISSGRVLAIGSGATVSVASDVAHKTSQRALVLAMTTLYGFMRAVDTSRMLVVTSRQTSAQGYQ